VVLTVVAVLAAAGDVKQAKGQQVFVDMKCGMCHGVSTAGIESKTKSEKMYGGDLAKLKLGDGWDNEEAVMKYIKQESELDGEKHKKGFKGTDEELQALVDWLLEQKAE
jgi:cytochrome c5